MFQQVEVDMFRMAALFVVERLKPWLMTYLAALLATAAPAPLICQASGRCVSLDLPTYSISCSRGRHLCSNRTARHIVTNTFDSVGIRPGAKGPSLSYATFG